MKAKRNIAKKRERLESVAVEPSKQLGAQAKEEESKEQPNPLPTPSNEERKAQLAPWQKEIVALAEAHLSVNTELDLVPHLLRRAIGLCRVVEDFSLVGDDNDLSMEALGMLMEVVGEDLQVAKWLTSERPLDPRWD